MFDTKVALIVREDLAVWRKLNVTAFLATGIAGAVPEAMGETYEDAAGRRYARLLGQPILVFAAGPEDLRRAHRIAGELDGGNVVFLVPDDGWKYLSSGIYTRPIEEIKDLESTLWW